MVRKYKEYLSIPATWSIFCKLIILPKNHGTHEDCSVQNVQSSVVFLKKDFASTYEPKLDNGMTVQDQNLREDTSSIGSF